MPADASFQMTVEDVFSIRGHGTVVTGKIAQGVLRVGDEVQLRHGDKLRQVTVTGIETFRKQMKEAGAGATVGLLLKDLGKDDVQRGDVLSGSGSEFNWNF